MKHRHAALLVALSLFGCDRSPRTQVMVFVRAEREVQGLADRLEVEIFGGATGEARATRGTLTYTGATSSEFFPLEWPRRIALVPEGGDAARNFAVLARALNDGAEVARTEIVSGYLEGETLSLDVWLRDDCVEVSCPDGQACVRGGCEAIVPIDPCELLRFEDMQVPAGCSPGDAGALDGGTSSDAATLDGGIDGAELDAGQDAMVPHDGGPPNPLDLYNVVFVTSTPRAAGSYGGIDGAHLHCQMLAEDAELPEPTSYRAFLSTETVDAINLLTGSRGWVRPDGRPFADEPADMMAGEIFYPIAVTETGGLPTEPIVATGTDENYEFTIGCGDWDNMDLNTMAGHAFDGPRFWLNRRFGFEPRPVATNCRQPTSLYCFGTGRNRELVVAAPPSGAGGIFLSSGRPRVSGDGVTAFDAICQAEGGPDYISFLPVDASSLAISRLASFSGPWVRPDGVVVAETRAQLVSERLLAPPIQTAFGVYAVDGRYWSIETSPDMSSGFTCGNWTSGGNARFSYAGRAHDYYSAAVARTCMSPPDDRVLCISAGAVYP